MHPDRGWMRDLGLALLLAGMALLAARISFLAVDGARVLWTGGALVVGMLAVLPPRRWWPYVIVFAPVALIGLQLQGWSLPAAMPRTVLEVIAILAAAAVLRGTGWLQLSEPAYVWGVLGVGIGVGAMRALGLELIAWGVGSSAALEAAQAFVVVLSTTLGLLTAAPLVALIATDWQRPMPARLASGDLGRTAGIVAALAAVLILSGPILGDVRFGILQFAVLAYAALILPAVLLAAVLVLTSVASVAVTVAFFDITPAPMAAITVDSGVLVVLPLLGLALMSWIVYSVRATERQSARRISAIMDSLLDPHVLMTPVRDAAGVVVDFAMLDANEAAAVDHGVPRDVLIGSRLSEVAPSEIAMGMVPRYASVIETGEPLILDAHPFIDDARGGELRSFDLVAVRIPDGLVVTWRDVTDREEEAAELARREQQYRLLAENAMDLVFFVDPDDTVRWVSPSIESALGYVPDELVGRSGRLLVHPGDDAPALVDAARSEEFGQLGAQRLRLRSKSGEHSWYELTMRTLRDDDGALTGGVVSARDVDAEVRAGLELERELLFDSLTGLARRPLALTRIQEILDRQAGRPWALLIAGVDRLTVINTAYGFTGGDRVLEEVGARLVEASGAHDRVARLAGDEFAIMMQDLGDPASAARAARRVLDAVRGPIDVGGSAVEVTACIGIAMSDGQSPESLLAEATAAMWQATAGGTDRWGFLDGDAGEQSRLELERQGMLRGALAEGRVRAWYMPIVDLVTGDVRGYEALARCIEDDGSVRPPADFLPAAEASGAMLELDRVMLAQAIEALVTLPADLHVAVNISSTSLAVGALAGWTTDRLRAAGVAPHRLHLEVTETSLIDVSAAVAAEMTALADLGIVWWVDDFGTGFSSISHLRDLPIGGLKLDRSFTMDVHDENARAASLAGGLAGLANGLDLLTVAEGVEDELQAQVLAAQGWALGQGYLYGAASLLPVAAELTI